MLIDAANVRTLFEPGPEALGWLTFDSEEGPVRLRRMDEPEFRRILRKSTSMPVRLAELNGGVLWLFQDRYIWDDSRQLSRTDVHDEMERRAQTS